MEASRSNSYPLGTSPDAAPALGASPARVARSVGLLLLGAMTPVTMLVAPLKELVAERYDASTFWTSSFMAVNLLGALLAAPLIGYLADRAGSRKRVVASALVADAAFFAAMAHAPSLATLFLLRFLEGIAHILAISALLAIASAWAPSDRRGRMMGAVGACMMFGTAIGTRLGGAVHGALGEGTFHVAGAIAFGTALLCLALLSEPPAATHGRSRFSEVYAALMRRRALLAPFAFAFIDRLCIGVVITIFGLFLADIHGLDANMRSRLLIWFLVPFALLVYSAGRLADRIGRVWPMAIGSLAFGLVFAAYGVASITMLHVLMVLSGVFSAIMFAPSLTICADLAPQGARGAAYAGFNLAGSLGFVVGPIFGGVVFSHVERHAGVPAAYRIVLAATGALEVCCALGLLPVLLRLRRSGLTR